MPSLIVCGMGGVLASRLVLMGWGCGRISGKGGGFSLVSLDWRWGMGLGQNFDMICGAGIGC
jgi:hypothetical protein